MLLDYPTLRMAPVSNRLSAGTRWLLGLTRHKVLALAFVGILPVVLRLAVTSWVPHPYPSIHDEFSYLLAADTFATGRLSNPTHPMWIHFEAFHVLQHPTYASKFLPGQGLLLAAGQVVFGDPIVTVWLSAGVMCGSIFWMLKGWVPAPWAFLGALLAAFRCHAGHYWMDSYWGATLAASGGALVLGAVARAQLGRRSVGAILGVGVAALSLTRPYEGVLLTLPIFGFLLWRIVTSSDPTIRSKILRILMPTGLVLVATGLFLAYFDSRVTGHPLQIPYTLYERQYQAGMPAFIWQRFDPPSQSINPEMRQYVTGQATGIIKYRSWQGVQNRVLEVLGFTPVEFGWLRSAVVLGSLPWVIRRRNMILPVIVLGVTVIGLCLTDYYLQHYSAPITAVWILLYVQCFRLLLTRLNRRWHFVPWFGFVTASLTLLVILTAKAAVEKKRRPELAENRYRITQQLERLPGKHLVFVRYAKVHDTDNEWVYNRANIDESKIVWGLWLDPQRNAILRTYYGDRTVWVLDPDQSRPDLRRDMGN